jgi:hypothetical protein
MPEPRFRVLKRNFSASLLRRAEMRRNFEPGLGGVGSVGLWLRPKACLGRDGTSHPGATFVADRKYPVDYPFMVRYPFDVLRAGGEPSRTAHHERQIRYLPPIKSVRPEVYPPTAAPEATRVSKGERDFLRGIRKEWTIYDQ